MLHLQPTGTHLLVALEALVALFCEQLGQIPLRHSLCSGRVPLNRLAAAMAWFGRCKRQIPGRTLGAVIRR